MFVKAIGTLLLLSGVCQAQTLPDFELSLSSLDSQLKESLSDDAFTFTYNYTGPTDANLEVLFKLYDADCVTELSGSALSEKATGSPAVDDLNDEITGIVSVDLSTIVGDATWGDNADADATTFSITYCARLELYYGDDTAGQTKTFVNYHETNVVAAVTMTEASGFELINVEYDLVEDLIDDKESETIQVDYTLEVSKCDAAGTITAGPVTTIINQGEPIYLCVGYSGVDDVYVQDIWDFEYYAVDKDDGVTNESAHHTPVVAGVKQNLVTNIDCATKADFCIVGFYVDGTLFDGNAEDDDTRTVKITGTALISFGADTVTRKLLDFRELAESGGMQQQEFEGEAGFIAPHPHGETSKPRHNFAFVIIGAMGSVLSIFGLAYYERKRREKFGKAKEVIVAGTEQFQDESNSKRGDDNLYDVKV
mmetsp:Transcript_8795/g.16855  ORF Transcript_8795/g.16855 Transcript_8795/m.16855 type:complete len:424 (+) Transcript_8795:114-1385(+)|eukprot:scaffold10660_cov176-Amphora_coffeaeformis.AAC.9